MKISAIDATNKHVIFKAGKSILYSDFDGTLLAQPLHDVYNGMEATKRYSVKGFNRYFKEFQDYIDETKGKFSIIVNTGRRLTDHPEEGFEPTYFKMKKEGIVLPEIASVITSEGGDIYDFNPDGTISHVPNKEKALAIKKACGWDNDVIKKTMTEISEELKTDYKFVDNRGSYKLSVVVQDKNKINKFADKLKKSLEPKMGINVSLSEVRDNKNYIEGLKLSPLIDGHHLHKDFDIKSALEKAIKENDFLIVAGDADNDKEALNIFRYIKNPPQGKVPNKILDITEEFVLQTKEEINKLPIKILFIEPNKTDKRNEIVNLHEYMKKLQELFPKKVEVVKETKLFEENYFLNAIKNSVENYSKENQIFNKARNAVEKKPNEIQNVVKKINKQTSKTKVIPIIIASCLLGIASYAFFKQKSAKLKNH